MKKVLIISEIFAPENTIAAIRVTKIAKYLALNGYQIDVLTRKKKAQRRDRLLEYDLRYINNIFYNENSTLFSWIDVLYQKIDGRLSRIFKHWKRFSIACNIRFIMLELYQQEYAFRAKKIKPKFYDIVFSSFGPISGHLIAISLKKKFRDILWIADFRDPMLSNYAGITRTLKNYVKRQWNLIIHKADHVTGATFQSINLSESNTMHVLFNGFDYDDCKYINNKYEQNNNKLIFTYTGLIYEERARMLPVFFKIISEIIDERIIAKENIEINCAGGYSRYFFSSADKYGLADIIIDHGLIERIESLKLQKHSDFLMHLTWNKEDDQDVFTGKLFEQLMLNRPILSFIAGERKKSTVKELIHNARVGICYQESNHETDYILMKNFIITYINSDRINFLSPNNEVLKKFDWKNNIKNLTTIIEGA
jgi:hypothetical protein